MNRPRPQMTESDMQWATRMASTSVHHALRRADLIRNDHHKDRRLAAHFCVGCFYTDHIGGAAMTTVPCMCCAKEQMYGSTYTDKLCLECAREHALCKHCGGDFEMNSNRRVWPAPQA